MSISVFPFDQAFAAEVGDVDLRHPSPEDVAAISAAFARYAVLVFPAQPIELEHQMAFAANFGPLETRSVDAAFSGRKARLRAEIADVGNLDADGRIWDENSRFRKFQMGNRLWHTDSSFKAPSGYVSMLYGYKVAPIGGHTQFCDLRAAYDALPEATRATVEGLQAEHSLMFSRARLGFVDFTDQEKIDYAPVVRPLVRTIPESGRRSLYIASHIGHIHGMSDPEAIALVDELTRHATQPRFVYTHRWRDGDLVMWDNRCTMHRGTAFEDTRWVRDLRRVTTSDRIDAFGRPDPRTTPSAAEY